MDQPRYNIRAVQRITGVPAPTLRSWERRYGFPSPSRTATARRLYSEQDVDAIRWVKNKTEQGLSVAQAIQWIQDGGTPDPAAPQVRPEVAVGYQALVDDFVAAARRYDEAAAEEALASAFARHVPDDVLEHVVAMALIEIGELWARGEIPVSAEHFATHIVRRRLLAMLAQQPVQVDAPLVVLACVSDEEHEVGLLMLALYLRWAGLRVLYLGAKVPADDLARTVRETNPAAVCLSAISPTSGSSLSRAVARLRSDGAGAIMFAGGPAADSQPSPPGVHIPTGGLRDQVRQIVQSIRDNHTIA